jgi:hypothetical protein
VWIIQWERWPRPDRSAFLGVVLAVNTLIALLSPSVGAFVESSQTVETTPDMAHSHVIFLDEGAGGRPAMPCHEDDLLKDGRVVHLRTHRDFYYEGPEQNWQDISRYNLMLYGSRTLLARIHCTDERRYRCPLVNAWSSCTPVITNSH